MHNHFATSMISIYLDWNCFVHMMQGIHEDALATLRTGTRKHALLVPYSYSHLEEASGIAGPDSVARVERRLDFIEAICGHNYLTTSSTGPQLTQERPHDVYRRHKDDFALEISRKLGPSIGYDVFKDARKKMGLDPKRLNNIPPADALLALDHMLRSELATQWLLPGMKPGLQGMIDNSKMIEPLMKRHVQATTGIEVDFDSIDPYSFRFSQVFGLLDTCGFWTDKRSEHDKGSRIEDSTHAYLASYCSIFASNDKRLRNKAQACFSFFERTTEVTTLAELPPAIQRAR